MSNPRRWRRAIKQLLFVAGSAPAEFIAWRFFSGIETDPVAWALNALGLSTLISLLATLSCTPLNRLSGWSWPLAVRRMLGLFAFFYAGLHFALYLAVDRGFAWDEIWSDVVKRRFMTAGFAAFLCLVPLAVTSTDGWVKRLGHYRWKRLHRLVYGAAILGIVHFMWRVKVIEAEQIAYAVVLAALLGARFLPRRARSPVPSSSSPPPTAAGPSRQP